MDNEGFSDGTSHDEDDVETSFSVCPTRSSQEDNSTIPQDTMDVEENMDRQRENGNVSGKTVQDDEGKTETSVRVATELSVSHEGESTAGKSIVPFCGVVFYIMAFFGYVCAYALRVSLSVAIVAMVNYTVHTDTTNVSGTDQCPRDPELQHTDGEFTWDRHQQGTALATFYYGCIITQVRNDNK